MTEIKSESDMLSFAENYGQELLHFLNRSSKTPAELSPVIQPARVIELVGDVGAGKTTFVRGLAKGLGSTESVTSPSFTISKVYALKNGRRLVHYDFYRLPDPGLMRDELAETLNDPKNIVVVEWADSVQDLLPSSRQTIKFTYSENPESPKDANDSEILESSEFSDDLNNPETLTRTLEFIPSLETQAKNPESA